VDYTFSEIQEELRKQAHEWARERWPLERAQEAQYDPSTWAELAELGWLGVSVPEEQGGAGLSFLEEAVLLDELGYALYAGPFFSTVALALPALDADDAAKVAAGDEKWSAVVDGRVPDLDRVDRVLTGDGAVAGGGEVLPTMDETRPLGKLNAKDAALDRSRVLAATALEAVGVGQRALELAVEYVGTREQFGRKIGVYQAVSHQVVDALVDVELARSLAYWAAWAVSEGDPQAPLAAAAAKAKATEAAVAACERSIQVHGGIGFTWEHPLHRYYKRAQWLESFAGYPSVHRAVVAKAVLAGETEATVEPREPSAAPAHAK
jgi:alkylation response protein AidB-like acyl-CoA dehydrogenase